MTDRPRLAQPDQHRYLHDAAVHLLRQREEGYPALITAGSMREAEAVEKLELSRCLVAQWRWVMDPANPPLPPLGERGYFGAWARELADELAGVAAKARARADKEPGDDKLAEMADLCEALHWYQCGHGSAECRITDDIGFARRVAAEWRAANPVRYLGRCAA